MTDGFENSKIQAMAECFKNISKIPYIFDRNTLKIIKFLTIYSNLRCFKNSNNSARNQKLHRSPYLLTCGFQGIYLSARMHSIAPVTTSADGWAVQLRNLIIMMERMVYKLFQLYYHIHTINQ